jgi:hypothetical protein
VKSGLRPDDDEHLQVAPAVFVATLVVHGRRRTRWPEVRPGRSVADAPCCGGRRADRRGRSTQLKPRARASGGDRERSSASPSPHDPRGPALLDPEVLEDLPRARGRIDDRLTFLGCIARHEDVANPLQPLTHLVERQDLDHRLRRSEELEAALRVLVLGQGGNAPNDEVAAGVVRLEVSYGPRSVRIWLTNVSR